jgi:hypothetical protein
MFKSDFSNTAMNDYCNFTPVHSVNNFSALFE